jgi:putative phosphoesterase
MILLFSDLHGNKKAAQLIESRAKEFDDIVCCGDICGYGMDFSYCISMCKELGVKSVLGNHDYMVINRNFALEDIISPVAIPIYKTRRLITQSETDYLCSLPLSLETKDGIYITHTYRLDRYLMTPESCDSLVEMTESKIIAIGHTHVMQQFLIGDKLVINPGSISKGRIGTSPSYMIIDNNKVIERRIDPWQ